MSWDIDLIKDEKIVEAPSHQEGGIIAVGGTEFATISVTYNYNHYFCEYLDKKDGFRWLDKRPVEEAIPRLKSAIEKLGTEQTGNYWENTPGNAGIERRSGRCSSGRR